MDRPEMFPFESENISELERRELDELMDSIITENLETFKELAK